MPLIKSFANWDQLVIAPSVQGPRGCLCMTCGRLVDEEGVVEGYPLHDDNGSLNPDATTWCKFLVRHHGAEELRTFDLGTTNWSYEDVASMAMRTNWFDPTRHEGLGLGHRNDKPGEHDDVDAPKIISMPSFGGGPRA